MFVIVLIKIKIVGSSWQKIYGRFKDGYWLVYNHNLFKQQPSYVILNTVSTDAWNINDFRAIKIILK